MDVKHLAAILGAVLGVGLAAGPALAKTNLTGEVFTGNTASDSLTCSGTTLSFSASGTATGPFMGTFIESGTAGITAAGTVGSALTSLSASFRVVDASGNVILTGTQKLITGSGSCNAPSPSAPNVVHGSTSYRTHPHASGAAQMEISTSATTGTTFFSDQFNVGGP